MALSFKIIDTKKMDKRNDLERDNIEFSDEDFDFNDYFELDDETDSSERYVDEDYYQEEDRSNAGIKGMVENSLQQGKLGEFKEKFNNFKYNGGKGDTFDVHDKSLDDRRKKFLLMAGASLFIFIIIMIYVFVIKK